MQKDRPKGTQNGTLRIKGIQTERLWLKGYIRKENSRYADQYYLRYPPSCFSRQKPSSRDS